MLIKAKQIISESWEMYRKNFFLFIKAMSWLFIPFLAVTILERIIGTHVNNLPWLWPTVIILLLSFILFILGVWTSVIMINLCDGLYHNKSIKLKLIYQSSTKKFFNYLWVSILIGLIIFFSSLAFIVPGLVFGIWLSFALIIVILEDVKGTKAISASKAIVDERFCPIAWRWVVPTAAFLVPMFIIIAAIELLLNHIILGNIFSTIHLWWFAIIENGASILFFAPVFTAVGVILYNELKKENGTN